MPAVQVIVHMYQYIIDLISEKKKTVSIEFVPAENDSLVMQMVSSGRADFSPYLLRLSPERLDWNGLEHAGPLFPARNVFLFKSGKNKNASLDLLSIFPWKVYIFLFVLLAALFGLGKLKNRFVTKIRFRMISVIGIFASIFYAYLSSQVVILFNTKVPTSEPIDSFDSLVEALASQKYRLMDGLQGADQGVAAWAGQQSQVLFQRVTEAFGKYPPQKTFDARPKDIAHEILVSAEPFPVLITSSSFLPFYTKNYCGLAVVYDDVKITEFDTLFIQKGLPGMKRITSAHRALIRAEFERLLRLQYPMKSCYRQGLQSALSYEPLELPQLQYVFGLVLAIAGAGGMTLLAIEWLSGRLWNHPSVQRPEELGQLEEVKQELQKAQQLLENISEGNAEVAELINAAIPLLSRSAQLLVQLLPQPDGGGRGGSWQLGLGAED